MVVTVRARRAAQLIGLEPKIRVPVKLSQMTLKGMLVILVLNITRIVARISGMRKANCIGLKFPMLS